MDFSRCKILIVDDELIMREYLGDILADQGFLITKVANGEEALKKIDAEFFNLVITDMKMPGPSGADVFHHTLRKAPDTRVIIMTAYALDSSDKKFLEEGLFGFILKPFEISQIRNLVLSAFQE